MTPTVQVAVPDSQAELAADALWQAGAVAVEERPGLLVAATASDEVEPLLDAVAGRWPAEVVAVDLDAALDAWRAHARPVTVGDRLVVRPAWPAGGGDGTGDGGAGAGRRGPGAAERHGRVETVIDPGRAFGHGGHPTTRLVLDALDRLVAGGEAVLDAGCGSGVLAIAALALGAAGAVGIDIDPAARAATRANARRNGVADRLEVLDDLAAIEVADASTPSRGGAAARGRSPAPGGRYDLIVANMLLSHLIEVGPRVVRALAPGGTLVMSGVLVDQQAALVSAYASPGLRVLDEHRLDGWAALTLRAG